MASLLLVVGGTNAAAGSIVINDTVTKALQQDVSSQASGLNLCTSKDQATFSSKLKSIAQQRNIGAVADDFALNVVDRVKKGCLYTKANSTSIDLDSIVSEAVQAMNKSDKKAQKVLSIDRALAFKARKFDFHFNAGYAFTSVNSLGTKGSPYINLGLYRTFSKVPRSSTAPKDCYSGFDFYGMHLATQFKLIDAGEQQPITAAAGAVKIGPNRAFEFETLAFFPLYHAMVDAYDKNRDYFFGVTALWSAKKISQDPATATNQNKPMLTTRYFGVRGAIGPEAYTDIMLGRAEGASGTRLLIRGQMPYHISSMDQVVYLGLEGNLGIKNRKSNTSAETIRGYIAWRFDDFFSILKGSKADDSEKE